MPRFRGLLICGSSASRARRSARKRAVLARVASLFSSLSFRARGLTFAIQLRLSGLGELLFTIALHGPGQCRGDVMAALVIRRSPATPRASTVESLSVGNAACFGASSQNTYHECCLPAPRDKHT